MGAFSFPCIHLGLREDSRRMRAAPGTSPPARMVRRLPPCHADVARVDVAVDRPLARDPPVRELAHEGLPRVVRGAPPADAGSLSLTAIRAVMRIGAPMLALPPSTSVCACAALYSGWSRLPRDLTAAPVAPRPGSRRHVDSGMPCSRAKNRTEMRRFPRTYAFHALSSARRIVKSRCAYGAFLMACFFLLTASAFRYVSFVNAIMPDLRAPWALFPPGGRPSPWGWWRCALFFVDRHGFPSSETAPRDDTTFHFPIPAAGHCHFPVDLIQCAAWKNLL